MSETGIVVVRKRLSPIDIPDLIVRKERVLAALAWLRANNDLYTNIGRNEENER